mmetsp:Transcript_117887/g.334272  ORF Transcript_117887/g.334272 Transcript_117887/m.334272 type:complete len:231 (-) Transcript_117887:95-787(-)
MKPPDPRAPICCGVGACAWCLPPPIMLPTAAPPAAPPTSAPAAMPAPMPAGFPCIICCCCGGSDPTSCRLGASRPFFSTKSTSVFCCASMQPFTAMTAQSTRLSIPSGTSQPAMSARHTAHEARQTDQIRQSSQGVFWRSNRVCMRKRFAEIAKPVQQHASSQTQFWSCGSPNGPHGNNPPQQMYGSPMTLRMSRRCCAAMQQEQQHPRANETGAFTGASKSPICQWPVS